MNIFPLFRRRLSTPAVVRELDAVITALRGIKEIPIMNAEPWATALAARLEAVKATVTADALAAASAAAQDAANTAVITSAVTDLETAANAPAPVATS